MATSKKGLVVQRIYGGMPQGLQKGMLEHKFRAVFCGKISFRASFPTEAELLCKVR